MSKASKNKDLEKRVNILEQKVSNIEKILESNLGSKKHFSYKESLDLNELPKEERNISHINQKVENKKEISTSPSYSFTQIISFLGITGIIIGLLSLYFYAVAYNWISKGGQIAIGILLGLVLYFIGILKYSKKSVWGSYMIGGGLFVEFLSIYFGVLDFRVINEVFGFFLLMIFLVLTIILSIKLDSIVIANYGLIGGYLIPIISGFSANQNFVLSFYLILSFALLIISYYKNWAQLRGFSFLIENLFLIGYTSRFIFLNQSIVFPVVFLVLNFLLYNISTLIFSYKNSDEIQFVDILILNVGNYIFIVLLWSVLNRIMSKLNFGLTLLPLSFLFLFEMLVFKSKFKGIESKEDLLNKVNLSLFSSGVITINLVIMFILTTFNVDILMFVFIIEWFLFSYLSKFEKEWLNNFKIFSYVFLFLVAVWYLSIVRFDQGVIHATFFLAIFALVPIGYLVLNYLDVDKDLKGAGFLISLFLFIFSFSKYLLFFIENRFIVQILLSVMWLVYTLTTLFFVSYNKNARILVYVLLAITLFKIALYDLTLLRGVYRIIGFIIFGIILIIGGYFVKNENN